MNDPSLKRDAANIIAEATTKQRAASDPLVSSWVGASAGSGKTKVLTDRILRLLLPRENGEPASRPEKILALTFTKAGANEMALRLSKRLSDWAVMDADKLAADMESNLLGRPPRTEELDAARKLFARVVDAPGGLNIMTIHSFCQSVLSRFPVEAGLPPGFKPLEEEEAAEYLSRSKADILSYAMQDRTSPLGQAVANISTLMNEEQFGGLIKTMVGERHQMEQILRRTFGVDGLYTNLCRLFDTEPGTTEKQALTRFCTLSGAREAALRDACTHLAASAGVSDRKKADVIQAFWDAGPAQRAGLYDSYAAAFITSGGTIVQRLATAGVLNSAPHIQAVLEEEANRILLYDDMRKRIACATATRDLFHLGDAIVKRYQDIKDERGALDFDDLIIRTLSLFKGEYIKDKSIAMAPWVLYKMDEGLDHILVDEAQDTNPEQWEIVKILSAEFFNGTGARESVRTVFVVGDEKQSIFGFQRAEPKKFEEMYRWFEKIIRESGSVFRSIDINTSFRSVQAVLDAVDTVFDGTAAGRGLAERYFSHIAKREGQGGTVEIWPLLRTSSDAAAPEEERKTSSENGWDVPDRIVENESGSLKMAHKIGDKIKSWIGREELESYGRPIQAGDILILVRSRNAFVGQLVRVLKRHGIPVSGIDRMVLSDQLVVQDLCAAASFTLLPENDLALACLLKSPFIGYSEDRLYALAQGREKTLWQKLLESGDGITISWLNALLAHAGADHPYEFFSRIVQEPCPVDSISGRRAIRARLGEDAIDPLDEFMNATLDYEAAHTAGLQGFLKWHEEESSDIKRQLEESGGAVRIMTVHASKGLQAPIVFLPDTVRSSGSIKPDRILWPQKTNYDVPIYIHSKSSTFDMVSPAQTTLETRMEEEYRRLLYVAMTRAEERLYIGGYMNKREPGNISYWYEDVRSALDAMGDRVERIPSGVPDKNGNDIPVLRLSSPRTGEADKRTQDMPAAKTAEAALESWVFNKAPAEPVPPRPLVPSRPSEEEPAAASPLSSSHEYRFLRGTVTHKLMQFLPDLPSGQRRIAAERFMAQAARDLPPPIREDIVREVMTILEDPVFGDIFGPRSMAEVAVSGLLDGARLVSGQIDRLLVGGKQILVVDYKTNRPPPQRTEDVPPVYVRQMRAYADTLRAIYPGRTVRCALLWTDGARLMEIPV